MKIKIAFFIVLFTLLFGGMAMSAEVLIMAVDFPSSGFYKGYPVVVKESPAVWGSKEGLPNFIVLKITDTPASVVEHFLSDWKIKYTHTIVNQNSSGYRIRVEVDPLYISASDVGANQIKTEMQDWVTNWGGSIVNFTSTSMTFDAPKCTGTDLVGI